MIKVFQTIDILLKAKQGVEHPDELMADLSFGFIEIYFFLAFLVLGGLTALLTTLGIIYNITFLLIMAALFGFVLIGVIALFIVLKRLFGRVTKQVVKKGKKVYTDVHAKVVSSK